MSENPPDYVQSPFIPQVHQRPAAADQTTGLEENTAKGLRSKLISSIIQLVVQAVTGSFIPGMSAFDQLRQWAENLPIIGDILRFVQPIIDALLGLFGGDVNGGSDTDSIFNLLLLPLQLLQSSITAGGNALAQLQAQLAGLNGQMQAANANIAALLSATSTAAAGGVDNFNRATLGGGWTTVAGTPQIVNREYVQCDNRFAGLINVTPESDKHGISFRIQGRQAGVCRGVYSSNDTMTNFVAVELYAGWFGNDQVRFVVGSSPDVVVIRNQPLDLDLRDNYVFESWYDPATNTFHTMVNGQLKPSLDFIDTTNLVTHGSTKRRVGMIQNCEDQGTYGLRGFGITDLAVITKVT